MFAISQFRVQIAQALLYIVRQKDLNLYEHSVNVSIIATNIANEMKLSKEQVYAVKLAALLHDIGKILIPSEILNKNGRLTNLEYHVIKKHVNFSFKILQKYDLLKRIALIVLRHHERLDGSGYPYKLRKDDIPIESRIIACADVLEAMAFPRSYRFITLPAKAGLHELNKNKGILYDSDVVDAINKLNGFIFHKEQPVKKELVN